MARNKPAVLLGFDDELITEKHKKELNFAVNKLGGLPDFPNNIKLDQLNCPLCRLTRPLVVQIYAPLENSSFHRTLYVFACVDPLCWNRSESWLCIRVQKLDEKTPETTKNTTNVVTTTEWCSNADNWDDDDNSMNVTEENGNVVEKVSEDEESCSLDESFRSSFGALRVDERNANSNDQGGAVGRNISPAATAELEGNEGEVISIDTPSMPQYDLPTLLHEYTPLPKDIYENRQLTKEKLQFTPYFISVWEETVVNSNSNNDRHVKELLQEYQRENELFNADGAAGGPTNDSGFEKYEKALPPHGDKMFHHFLSKIQANPGQILRYCRDLDQPLLLEPLHDLPKKCQYCDSELTFEFQILPTIITKLKLIGDPKQCTRLGLDFGTILIFTCKKSCWETDTNARIETVILQSEIYC